MPGTSNLHLLLCPPQLLLEHKVMVLIDQSLLESRFYLRKTKYISARFEKSPNITNQCTVSDYLLISYADQDVSILPLIQESFLRAYTYTKDWFGYRGHMAFDLWMAPKVIDLQYMTCLPCDEGFFCAPGNRGERKIILFVSPLSSQKNADKSSLTGCLAHEIAHHIIQDISCATILTMKRKEDFDLPMWLEEGLCQLIQSEVHPSLQRYFTEDIDGKVTWCPLEDLWNDLYSCEDVRAAYLQAYRDTKALVAARGKSGVIHLLHLNRTHDVNWNDVSRSGNNGESNLA